jgi:hypothetical protein
VYDENDDIFILLVDGVDCSITEPRKIPSAKWYSHKFNGPGLSYELGISIYDNYLVWIRGPERAGWQGPPRGFPGAKWTKEQDSGREKNHCLWTRRILESSPLPFDREDTSYLLYYTPTVH